MKTKKERLGGLLFALLITFLTIVGVVWADGPEHTTKQKQRFKWVVTKRLTVENLAIFNGLVQLNNELHISNTQDSVALDVWGNSTQTTDLFQLSQSDGTDKFTVSNEGHTTIYGERDATTGRDNFLAIEGDLGGAQDNANTRGQLIEVERPLEAIVIGTNVTDYGLMIRAKTKATITTAGPTLYGADIEAKTDDDGRWSILRGVQATAVTDQDGYTDQQTALRAHAEVAEGATITTVLQIADFELNRKSDTEPGTEYGLVIRNTSNTGYGADSAIRIVSAFGAGGSATTDQWDYGIDMSPANISAQDIKLSQGETIDNSNVDGRIDVTGDVTFSRNITVVGTTELGGNVSDPWGILTLDDEVDVTGNLTVATNLVVTGTSNLRGAVSDASGDLELDDYVVISNDLDVGANLMVTGTSNLQGNVFDNLGTLTIADDVLVDGQTDAVQLTSQGVAGQTADLLVAEDAVGNDQFSIGWSGDTFISGTLDVRGDVSDGAGLFTIADDANVTGSLTVTTDLVVVGTSDLQGDVSDSVGDLNLNDDVVVSGDVDIDTNLTVTGTTDLRGDVSDTQGVFTIVDDVDVTGSISVTGNISATGFISAGTALTSTGYLDVLGNVFDSGGTLTIDDDLAVTGASDLQGTVSNSTGRLVIVDVVDVTGSLSTTGNISATGFISAGTALTSTGYLDVLGNVFDSGSALTFADDVLVNGQVDLVQLTSQGVAGQTADLIVAEDAATNDQFSVGWSGDTFISGTLDIRGDVSDGAGLLTIADDVTVGGEITVTGGITVTGVISASTYITSMGGLDVTGNTNLQGTLSDNDSDLTVTDNITVSGNITVVGTGAFGGDLYDPWGHFRIIDDVYISDGVLLAGDLDVTADVIVTGTTNLVGNVSSSRGAITVTDDLSVTESIGLRDWLYPEPASVTLDITTTDTIAPTGTYQPLSVDGDGPVTVGNPSIADGAHIGDLLILINTDATQDIGIVDNQNIKSGGLITLTGGADDSVMFIWDGSDWICLGFHDN